LIGGKVCAEADQNDGVKYAEAAGYMTDHSGHKGQNVDCQNVGISNG